MKNRLVEYILANPRRQALPLGVYAGLGLTGMNAEDAATDPRAQLDSQLAWQRRYPAPILQTLIDVTVEAEIFGAQVRFGENEMPIIDGRVVKGREDLSTLIDPKVGHKRTTVMVTAAQWLKEQAGSATAFVLGNMSGPLTVAAQLYGVAELLELVDRGPDFLHELLEITTRFLLRYAWAFDQVGADGVILSEPVAGLLSPQAALEFSTPYVRRVIEQVQSERFAVIYHNCKARLEHLSGIFETGAAVYHFGAPMNLLAALDAVDPKTILAGNLDPNEVFLDGAPEVVAAKTDELLRATAGRANFVLSPGCQLLPGTPLPNVDAFYRSLEEYNRREG